MQKPLLDSWDLTKFVLQSNFKLNHVFISEILRMCILSLINQLGSNWFPTAPSHTRCCHWTSCFVLSKHTVCYLWSILSPLHGTDINTWEFKMSTLDQGVESRSTLDKGLRQKDRDSMRFDRVSASN